MHFVNVSAVEPELLCRLCGKPWPPSENKACQHCDSIYCHECIADRLLKTPSCANCGNSIASVDAMRVAPRLLRSMTERKVLVKCPNRLSCWEGPWGQLESHLKECTHDPGKIRYVGDVDDELKCPICLCPFDDPLSCPHCEQSFCASCARSALRKRAECATCRCPLSESTLTEPRPSLVAMLKRLQVSCAASCGWTGERQALLHHLSVCPERNFQSAPAAVAALVPAPAAVAALVPAPAAEAASTTPRCAAAETLSATAPCATQPPIDGSQKAALELTAFNYHPTVHEATAVVPFFAMAHVAAPLPAAPAAARKPLQITAVIDISGSMKHSRKMDTAKQALAFVTSQLSSIDRFGLIAFDDKVDCRLPLTDMNEEGRKDASTVIRSLAHRGGTNLSAGLFAGIAQVRDFPFIPPREATKHVDVNAASIAPPTTTTAGGIMSRLAALTSSVRSRRPPQPAAPGDTGNAATDDCYSCGVPLCAPLFSQAFTLVCKFNIAPCKRNDAWLARYTFEVTSSLPSSVAFVSVFHKDHGRVTLRHGPATLGLLPTGLSDFCVEITYKPEFKHTERVPVKVTPDEDGLGTLALGVPSVGTAPLERSRIVMLFTDGEANDGITDPARLTAKVSEIIAKLPEKDVTIMTFGFGVDHNATLLSAIAESTQGTYYYIPDTTKMKEIFADCIGGLLSIAATNLVLTIRPALGTRIAEVLTFFPTAPLAGSDGAVTVLIKDMYAEENRDVVVKLDVAPRARCPPLPLVTWELTYSCPGAPERMTAIVQSIAATVENEYTGAPNPVVDEQLNRYRVTKAMCEAQALADTGRVGEANQRIRAVKAAMADSDSTSTEYCRVLLHDLDSAAEATRNASAWQSVGQKQVTQMKVAHAQQRCNSVMNDDRGDAYVTSGKAKLRLAARS